MYQLKYFATGAGLCASDFENKIRTEHINLQQISSISDVKKFHTPFSDKYIGDFAIVTMQNRDRFFIDKEEYEKITNYLKLI